MTEVRTGGRLRAIALAAILVGSVFGTAAAFSGAAAAGNQSPTVTVDSPDHEANLTQHPTITGTASDDGTVEKVEIAIQRSSDDKYFTGSGWTTSETWITVATPGTESVDWSYDTYDLSGTDITDDDTYDVTAQVTDDDGNVVTGERPDPRNPADADAGAITYTVDTHRPVISSVTVADDTNGDGTVTDGDTVKVTVEAEDDTSGVDTVTVDASKLGGPSALTLSGSGTTYVGTFTVSNPSAGDGTVSLTATATDYLGYTDTATDSITLDTAVATVDSLTVHTDFVGVVADSNTSIRVTASGIEDARGNVVDDGTAQIAIAGTTYAATVSNGAVDTTIDPTSISDTASTGVATVDVSNAETSASDTVVLVHEAISLSEGYNLVGTPMRASDVRFDDVTDVTTYDPTVTGDDSSWVPPEEEQAGEGYYAFAESDDARVGYVFETNAEPNPDARYLHEGYNLVSAAPDLSESESLTITNDLGADVNPSSDSNVQASTYNGDDLSSEATSAGSAFVDRGGDHSITGYDGYFVYVEGDTRVRTIRNTTVGYDPSGR